MAEMTIRLRIDPETNKKEIIVSMRSDEDALPHEHEEQHRKLVDTLIEKGIAAAGDKIIIEREEDEKRPSAPVRGSSDTQREAQSENS